MRDEAERLLGADDRARDRRPQVVPQATPGRDHVAVRRLRDLDVHARLSSSGRSGITAFGARAVDTAYPSGAAGFGRRCSRPDRV